LKDVWAELMVSVRLARVPCVHQLKPVLNLNEKAAIRHLEDYARSHGYRIVIKPRFRDVINFDEQALPRRERDFIYKAHLDFVAADIETDQPLLAVEYDGHQHLTDPKQRERDEIKDRLCADAGLDLLRINNLFTRKEGRWRVLGYVLEMHEAGKAFAEAQEQGLVPEDEPFIHNAILDFTDLSRPTFTGLDTEALEQLRQRLLKKSVNWYGQWWQARDGEVEARSVLALPNGQYLSSTCTIRQFAIQGISAPSIAEELATAELEWLAQRYDDGEPVALNPQQGRQLLEELTDQGAPTVSFSGGWSFRAGAGVPDNLLR
jgi:very-short-patch-repair endonuclease